MRRSNGSATGALERAREELAQVSAQLGELASKRRERLLHGTDADVAKIDAEIEAAQRLQRTRADRVSALLEEAEREATARRTKEREGLIGRVEVKLEERTRLAAKLADLVAAADGALIELFAVNRAIHAAWPWAGDQTGAILVGDGPVLAVLRNEIYRVAGRPLATGGMPSDPRGPGFPGGQCADLSWIALPEKSSRPMTERFVEAADAAKVIMRTGSHGANPTTNGSATPTERTDAQRQLSALLGEQARLAELDGEDAERQYKAIGEQIAQLSQESAA